MSTFLTVADLKTLLLQRLAFEQGDDHLTAAMQLSLLNSAYGDLIDWLELSNQDWHKTTPPDAISITWPAEQRETNLPLTTYPIRRIVKVSRTDTPSPVDLWKTAPARRDDAGAAYDFYVYRRGEPPPSATPPVSNPAYWVLGFAMFKPPAMTISVDYWPIHSRLTADDQVPGVVPPESHELIAIRAALIHKFDSNRETTGLEKLYGEKMAVFQNLIANTTAAARVRRF